MGFSLADIDRILEVYDDRDQLEQFFSARQRELEAIYLSHMCALDHAYARLMHARLIRTHTVATGADSSDYWYVPDKSETESESASGSIFNTVRRKKCAVKGTGTKIILEVQKKQKEDYKCQSKVKLHCLSGELFLDRRDSGSCPEGMHERFIHMLRRRLSAAGMKS